MEKYEAKHSRQRRAHRLGDPEENIRKSLRVVPRETIKYTPLRELDDPDLVKAFGMSARNVENPASEEKVAAARAAAEAARRRRQEELNRQAQAAVDRIAELRAAQAIADARTKAIVNSSAQKPKSPETVQRKPEAQVSKETKTGKKGKLHKVKQTLIALVVGLVSLAMVNAMIFYLLIGVGLSPKLQTLWVTTAMTTNSHKWLATSIVSEKRIAEIMDRETIDDTGFDTELDKQRDRNGYAFGDTRTEGEREEHYMNRGYGKLRDGLFLKTVSGNGWRGNVMLVENPLDIILVDTPTQGEKGTSVRRMVELAGGIAGINGGGFDDGPNYDSNGGKVSGLLIKNGKLINPTWDDGGYMYNMIGFNSEGRLILRHCTKNWALANDIQYAVSFSPFLIVNGEGTVPEGSSGGWGIAPRTAIGQLPTGEVLFLCIDGRQPGWSIGCDLDVLQDVLLKEGCENAAMMDGGSSTVMIYNNEFVNKPSLGHERFINNAWVVVPHNKDSEE